MSYQFFQAPLDLTPTYSGPMYGLCNGFGAVSGKVHKLRKTTFKNIKVLKQIKKMPTMLSKYFDSKLS